MRIPIAPGTPSGALPAATAARSLAHKESTRRSAREPSDGATATGPMDHSVSTAAPDPDATKSGSVSTGGASGMRIPIASGTVSGPPLRSGFSHPIVTISDYRKTAQVGRLETVLRRLATQWRTREGRLTTVCRESSRTDPSATAGAGSRAPRSCSASIRIAPSERRVASSVGTVSASRGTPRGDGGARVDDRSERNCVR